MISNITSEVLEERVVWGLRYVKLECKFNPLNSRQPFQLFQPFQPFQLIKKRLLLPTIIGMQLSTVQSTRLGGEGSRVQISPSRQKAKRSKHMFWPFVFQETSKTCFCMDIKKQKPTVEDCDLIAFQFHPQRERESRTFGISNLAIPTRFAKIEKRICTQFARKSFLFFT